MCWDAIYVDIKTAKKKYYDILLVTENIEVATEWKQEKKEYGNYQLHETGFGFVNSICSTIRRFLFGLVSNWFYLVTKFSCAVPLRFFHTWTNERDKESKTESPNEIEKEAARMRQRKEHQERHKKEKSRECEGERRAHKQNVGCRIRK